ncbi:MAG: hypothetical protein LBK05_00670, partial [Treponema sp.]|nr:hypothetical protein [Treponema sp.]
MELFRQECKDYRSYLINLAAMTTGLRVGEIIALKAEDIGEKYTALGMKTSSSGRYKNIGEQL